MRPPAEGLPFVDVHHVHIDAPPADVWDPLVATLRDMAKGRGATTLVLVLSPTPARADGDFPQAEGTIPGFRVAKVRPPTSLHLLGRHRFAHYSLRFELVADAGGTRLEATTHAAFPGLKGRAYRTLLVGGGLHARATRRLLSVVARRARGRAA